MSALHSLLPLLASGLLLGGCWYSSTVSGSKDGTADMRATDRAIAGTTPQQAQEFLAGKTWRSVEGSSGQQIHYSTSGGRDFVWMPNQASILAGDWRIDAGPDARGQTVTKLCLRYPDAAIHPVSKRSGAEWFCRAAGMAFSFIRERAEGDPLALATRSAAPFALGYGHETIAQLKAKIGR